MHQLTNKHHSLANAKFSSIHQLTNKHHSLANAKFSSIHQLTNKYHSLANAGPFFHQLMVSDQEAFQPADHITVQSTCPWELTRRLETINLKPWPLGQWDFFEDQKILVKFRSRMSLAGKKYWIIKGCFYQICHAVANCGRVCTEAFLRKLD
jgi:hypothetical protein